MAIFQRIKKVVKPFVNIFSWMDTQSLINTAKSMLGLTKKLFVPATAQQQEEFEAAMLRLNMTEQDIHKCIKAFKLYYWLFFAAALLLLVYSVVLFWSHSYRSLFAVIGLMMLLFGLAFRYHFWVYQMQQRKLGCTLSEWLDNGFVRIKK